MLGGIVSSGARSVVKAVGKASKDRIFRRNSPDHAASESAETEGLADQNDDSKSWSLRKRKGAEPVQSDALEEASSEPADLNPTS